MKLRPVMVWVMVGVIALGTIGIGWSVFRFQDSKQKESATVAMTCDELREFILAEEELSFGLWKKYHKQVMAYSRGIPKSERPAKVKEIATSVSLVLESDLRIYREMRKLPECLTPEFRSEVREWASTTREMIEYLAGERKVEGEKFDPKNGFWDTSFYDAFYSATDNLVEGITQI